MREKILRYIRDRRNRRFQECGWMTKAVRRLHYVTVPFMWVRWTVVGGLPVTSDEDGTVYRVSGRQLWSIMMGTAQIRMRYYWTHDELMLRFVDED